MVKGVEVKAKSRYEEDVLVNNHTAVWGSWWRDGTWGYACCHSCVKNSYCTGKVGGGGWGRGRGREVPNSMMLLPSSWRGPWLPTLGLSGHSTHRRTHLHLLHAL